jgi:hypothetical protein
MVEFSSCELEVFLGPLMMSVMGIGASDQFHNCHSPVSGPEVEWSNVVKFHLMSTNFKL